jgi:site-specific DNA recombinase
LHRSRLAWESRVRVRPSTLRFRYTRLATGEGNPPMRTLRLDALIRQSRASEAGRSPEQQREAIERWAAADGASIVAEHVGRGRSGKTVDRLDVNAALERIRAGESDGVVVAWVNRLSRAPVEDALRVIREIREAGGTVCSADHGGVLKDDPNGEMTLTIDLAMGRRQIRETTERYAQSRREAIAEGKHIGKAPFGYRFADPTPKKGSHGVADSHLVIDEQRAAIVRELFERKAGGATWLELARFLDQVAPKPNDTLWARQTVIWMIRNRAYIGEVRHGKYKNASAHDPIVTPALWRRAQNGAGRRTPRGTYLLSGIAVCAGCGRTLRGSALGRKPRKGRKASPPRIYTCANRECKARSTIVVDRLDAEVIEQFFDHLDDFHLVAVDDEDIEAARVAVEQRTEEVKSLAGVVPSHPEAVAAHQAALEAAEGALAEAEDHLDELTAAMEADGPDVAELRAMWPALTLAERREVLSRSLDRVEVRRAPHPGAKVPAAERIRVIFRK